MPTYISLANWTPKGLETIKSGPQRLEESKRVFESHGAVLKNIYIVLGSPDVVAIFEAEDDQTAASVGLAIAAGGTIRGTVQRAFDGEDYHKIVAKIK